MIFAVFLNEIKCVPFKKFVQTVTTLPNFISWVLVYSIAYCLLNSTGVVNSVMMSLGLIDSRSFSCSPPSMCGLKCGCG